MNWLIAIFHKGPTFLRWVFTPETLEREEPGAPVPADSGSGAIVNLLRRDTLIREAEPASARGSWLRWFFSTEELGREDEPGDQVPPSLWSWLISRENLDASDPETPGGPPNQVSKREEKG